jgi:cysteine-S-conjugate beta-lyase
MPGVEAVNRRAFLKNAGITALAGAVGSHPSLVSAEWAGLMVEPANGKYDFDTIYNRFGTDSVKFDQQIRTFGQGTVEVGMGIADMDFQAAPVIAKALQERLQHENWGYLDMPSAFFDEIISWNQRRYGVTIRPEQMVISAGVHPAIIAALHTFSPKGSKVLLQTPTYNGFYTDLRFAQVLPEESPLREVNGRYAMDFEDFERRIGHDTQTFVLCNPQNPTGNCWSADDLMRIGEICLRRRVIVLADEIHCDFVMKGQKYTPFASLPDKRIVDNSITFKAASKSFSLAAHKIAWFHSTNPDLLASVKVNHRADLSTLGVVANRAAYSSSGEDWLNQVVEYIDGTHEFAARFIKANIPTIKYVKPEGTYLAWLDVTAVAERIGSQGLADEHNRKKAPSEPALTPEQMIERYLVKHAKVHLNQGASYGRGGANHMRMNLATSRKLVEKALTNIAEALKRV